MRDTLIEISRKYNSLISKSYNPSTYPETLLVEKLLPQQIKDSIEIDTNKYIVEGSTGTGRWTHTPWVAVFDKNITTSARRGYYIVYLYKSDMSGVYISLNLGTNFIKTKYRGLQPRNKMRIIAENIRNSLIYNASVFPVIEIDLIASTDNSINYKSAHILGKYYDFANMPDEITLKADLVEMLSIYRQLINSNRNKSVDETLDFYLELDEIEDTQFQKDTLVSQPTSTPKVPKDIPPMVRRNGRNARKRNAGIAKEALINANYKCEVNISHDTFISDITKQNFVEAHHLIPMKAQENFMYSLDVPGNIISLCPNCHRKIHHAQSAEKKLLVNQLLLLKKVELEDFGIQIDFSSLIKYYS